MKTKPNFTYKEFIEKISQVSVSTKDNVESKSPRVLKSHNKNMPSSSLIYYDKPVQNRFSKNSHNKKKNSQCNLTPRRTQANQNIFDDSMRQIKIKKQSNQRVQLKSSLNTDRLGSRQQSMKQSKKIQYGQNFSYNQSCYENEFHNESCSTFYKNFNYDNEEGNFHNQSMGNNNKNSSANLRLKSKKHSTGSIDGKLKIMPKRSSGNLTDRDNGKRVATQYEESKYNKLSTDRLNTQYDKITNRHDRESPSFYKLSADESSLLDFEDERSHRTLLNESSEFGAKRSNGSMISQERGMRMNQKSYEFVYNKFMINISQILFQITKIQEQTQLLEHKVRYIQFLQCLKELKMIRSDYEPYSQGQMVDIVKQFWQQLVMGHNVSHFIIIVALVLKITPNDQIKGQDSMQMQNCVYLQKKYEQFRFTRLELDRSKNLIDNKESFEHNNFPFKPSISKISEELASKPKSEKRKLKINTSVNRDTQNSQIQTRRQNISINTQFQNPNRSVTSRSNKMTSPLGNKRSEILYKQAKKKSLQKRQNKSTIDYEYQKNKEQLTFKPKIIIKRKKHTIEEIQNNFMSPRVILDEEKTINRMIRGRVEREVKQMVIDRGIPYSLKSIDELRKEKYQEIIKQQEQSRLKQQQESYWKIKAAQVQDKKGKENERCTTQVENLQNILNLSFEANQNNPLKNQQDSIVEKQESLEKYISPSKTTQNLQQKVQEVSTQHQDLSQDYFTLDIYFEQDRSQKLMIRRDSTIEGVILQAQKFVQKHQLPKQMQQKLKQQLMIAMKFHDIEKIEENDQEEECSLLE